MKPPIIQLRCWLVLLSLAASLQITLGYYDPAAQRWINRDPIGERGFHAVAAGERRQAGAQVHSYVFVSNSPMIKWDSYGLLTESVDWDTRILCEAKCKEAWDACVRSEVLGGLGLGLAIEIGRHGHQTDCGQQKRFCRNGGPTHYTRGLIRGGLLTLVFAAGVIGVKCGSSYWGCVHGCSVATRIVTTEPLDSTLVCTGNLPPSRVVW